jgi:hypothetical protein
MTTTNKYPDFGDGGTGGVNFQSGGANTQNSKLDPTVAMYDSNGNVIKVVGIDPVTGQAIYATKLTAGMNGISGAFTGGNGIPVQRGGATNLQVGGSNLATAKTVTQNIAGPGIYLSNPNGKGNVVISTSPFPVTPNKETLYDVVWTTVYNKPYGVVPQFIATGANGAVMRSRDGKHWSQLRGSPGTTVLGVSSEMNSNIPDNHVEYNGVTYDGKFVYGRQGTNSDGMSTVGQLYDASGAITEDLVSTYIFINAGAGGQADYYNDMLTYPETGSNVTYPGIPLNNYSHSENIYITWYAQVGNLTLAQWLQKISNVNTAPVAEVIIDGTKKTSPDQIANYPYVQYVKGYEIVNPDLVALLGIENAFNIPIGSHTAVIKIWANFGSYQGNPTTPQYTFTYNFTIGP